MNLNHAITKIDAIPTGEPYTRVAHCLQADARTPSDLRNLIFTLIERFDDRSANLHLPASVMETYRADIARIREHITITPDTHLNLTNDLFRKDLAICAQRLYPLGAQVIEQRGIARRFVIRARGSTVLRTIPFFIKAGGFKPYYEMHTHESTLQDFNEQGWKLFYRRLADLMEINPRIKGVFCDSWFFDPTISKISPHLSYLRKLPAENGALLIDIGANQMMTSLATKTSKSRRELYEQGKYQPSDYLLIWRAKDILKWSVQEIR